MNCPGCSAALAPRSIGGEVLHECPGCRSTLLLRSAVRALAALPSSGDPALRAESDPVAALSRDASTKILACPRCAKSMFSFAFGGGRTKAEGCDGCDLVFFDAGELGQAVTELRSGVKLSDEEQSSLLTHGASFTMDRYSRAELAMAIATITGMGSLVWMARWTSLRFTTAVGLGYALFLVLWLRAERKRKRATLHLEAMVEADARRRETSARAAGPARPWAPVASPGGAAGATPAATKPAATNRTRPCPFCAAALPVGTTHCSQCDSDFG